MNTGLGVTTLSNPKFATSVPSVVSPTDNPTSSAKVKVELTRDLAKPARLCRLHIKVQGLRIVRHGREQQIVRLCNGAADFVFYRIADLPFVKIPACHASVLCPAGDDVDTVIAA